MNLDYKIAILLKQIIETSNRLIELDLDNEEQIKEIPGLQSAKAAVQDEINLITEGNYTFSDESKSLLQSCISLEKDIQTKFLLKRDTYRNHLLKIHGAERTRQAYSQAYSQADGFFIDRKK